MLLMSIEVPFDGMKKLGTGNQRMEVFID